METKSMYKKEYCVYLTIYSGNKLPPFYIGSGTTSNLNRLRNPYRGSVTSQEYKLIWKAELKENPHLFKTKIIQWYDTRNEAYLKEEILQIHLDVSRNPLYINKAIANNKFNMTGKKHSQNTKEIMSKSGKLRPPVTKETCRLLSVINQNISTMYDKKTNKFIRANKIDLDTIAKLESGQYVYGCIMRNQESRDRTSEALIDRRHYYNPETEQAIFIKPSEIAPIGFISGLSDRHKLLVSTAMTGSNYYYNSITNEQTRIVGDIIPDGFIRGKKYFGENGNFFSNNVVGIDIRTKEKSTSLKNSEESRFIIPHNVKIAFCINRHYCVDSVRCRDFLLSFNIVITTNKLNNFKSNKILLDDYPNITIVKIIDYKYSPNHIWI